jgi:murein DD-endopeptidase MepM/ murein hydrolase activator NlpD
MSAFRSRGFAIAALALLLTSALMSGAGADPVQAGSPNVNQAIAEQQQMEAQLAAGRAELARLQRLESTLASTVAQLNGSLEKVGLEIEKAAAQLDELTKQLEEARTRLADYKERIVSLEKDLADVAKGIEQSRVDLAARQELLQDHLRVAYEQSQTSLLEVILSSDSLGDATSQLGFMLSLSDQDAQLAEEIRQAKVRLEIKQQTLRDGRATLTEMRDAAAERAKKLDAQAAQVAKAKRELDAKRKQLAQLKAQRESQLAATKQHADEQAGSLADQERALEGQRQLVEQLKEQARTLDVAYRGRFAWPERGNFMVTQEFGRTSFSAYHEGLDMAYVSPHCGGPIYAAADGVVMADGHPNAKYGDTAIGVIIGHSQRLQSWYWHLSREVVSVGQQVRAGDLIGYEGATGNGTGCHLHLQVMFDGRAVNPRAYLP